ncbi:acyltransferase family protein [Sediminicola luteus]|uniref:Acyltransferase 3 domain-containing protein n=1 Tax=Sediminicola luteus TaxID=319238 RepID=A0A2A4GDS7_9FLAO|nr:acyltransferase [Sediminicola luteus]PCE66144.1 hypothetical protein B7P33_02265 [Sediminicola luteus]
MGKQRIFYLDNLRVLLTVLVVAHHWAIANGAPGDAYYQDTSVSLVESIILGLFIATNQAYFMGFFFFLSAFFTPKSLARKGKQLFFLDRLKRLGIPLLVYSFILEPLLKFWLGSSTGQILAGFSSYWASGKGFGTGPLWFVAVLLIFDCCYAFLGSGLLNRLKPKSRTIRVIIGLLTLILITFVVRMYFPVGEWVSPLGFQPAHLPQYILCYLSGIWVQQHGVLDTWSGKAYFKNLIMATALALIVFPLLFVIPGKLEDHADYMGGFTPYSFFYVVWEQLFAFFTILGLLGWFKTRFNEQPPWLRSVAQHSYIIYIIHGFVLAGLSLALHNYTGMAFQKFVLFLVPALLICYFLGKLIRLIPVVKRIV